MPKKPDFDFDLGGGTPSPEDKDKKAPAPGPDPSKPISRRVPPPPARKQAPAKPAPRPRVDLGDEERIGPRKTGHGLRNTLIAGSIVGVVALCGGTVASVYNALNKAPEGENGTDPTAQAADTGEEPAGNDKAQTDTDKQEEAKQPETQKKPEPQKLAGTWEKRSAKVGNEMTPAVRKELEGKGACAMYTVACTEGRFASQWNSHFIDPCPGTPEVVSDWKKTYPKPVSVKTSDKKGDYGTMDHPWKVCEVMDTDGGKTVDHQYTVYFPSSQFTKQ